MYDTCAHAPTDLAPRARDLFSRREGDATLEDLARTPRKKQHMSTDADPRTAEAPAAPTFFSMLKEGRQRFLAHAIEHGFSCGRRTPEDFTRHFPPIAIMKGLE